MAGSGDIGKNDLLVAVFVSGACAMVVELAGARLISPYLGNTIYTWTAVIGLVMAALSAGYYIGGSLGDRHRDRAHLSTILLCASILTVAIPFLGWMLLPLTTLIDLVPASIIASLILVPASLCYGMVSPYAIKLTGRGGEEGRSAGRVFALSTVGSIAGTLGTGFVLIPNVQLTHIFILAALLMLMASWLAGRKGKAMLMEGAAFAALAALISPFGFLPLFGGTVIHQEDSEYYHITVTEDNASEWKGGGSVARILYLDNAASSGEFLDGTPAFEYALKSRMAYELVPDPRNALVVGVAAGTQVEDLKRRYPGVMVDGVDIDARAVDAGRKFFSLKDDARTNITIDDARRYVRRGGREYDIVALDAFRGRTVPYNLATTEFLGELKGRMSGDGVAMANIISAVEGEKSAAFVRIYNTFSSVFDNVVVLPVGTNPGGVQNIVIIATDRDVSAFRKAHAADIYQGEVPYAEPLSDGLNPIELYVAR